MEQATTKQCPDCKSHAPADARICGHCRHRFGANQRFWGMGAALIVAVVAVGIGVVHGRGASSSDAATGKGSAPTPIRASSSDPKIDALLAQQAKLEEACRGGNVTIDSAICAKRDQVDARLSKAGWCSSEPGDSAAERGWHDCVAAEVAPVSQRHRKWIRECQDAILTDLADPTSATFPNPAVDPGAFIHAQESDMAKGPDPRKIGPAAFDAWMDQHADMFSETISFKFHAKNLMGGVQRYTATCTFLDNFDGSTKLTRHSVGVD